MQVLVALQLVEGEPEEVGRSIDSMVNAEQTRRRILLARLSRFRCARRCSYPLIGSAIPTAYSR